MYFIELIIDHSFVLHKYAIPCSCCTAAVYELVLLLRFRSFDLRSRLPRELWMRCVNICVNIMCVLSLSNTILFTLSSLECWPPQVYSLYISLIERVRARRWISERWISSRWIWNENLSSNPTIVISFFVFIIIVIVIAVFQKMRWLENRQKHFLF